MARLLSLALTSILGLGLALPAAAAPLTYTVIDLGEVSAAGLNNVGQVTGTLVIADGSPRAFITGPDGNGMTTLGTLGGAISRGVAINDTGQVTGHASVTGNRDQRAFITGANGVGMVDLGIPPRGPDDYYGTAINNAGLVAGDIALGGGSAGASFVTGPNGIGMRPLETGGWESSIRAINNAGQVVGGVATGSGGTGPGRAFITGPNGAGLTLIEQFDGVTNSMAFGINDSGQVTGVAAVLIGPGSGPYNPDVEGHVFITGPNGVGMTDLGRIGGSGSSYGWDINNAGQVVGWFEMTRWSTFTHAFVTGPDGIGATDLNNLVDLPGDAYFSRATGINDRGQIIANASDGHAYLLSPFTVTEPETMSLALTCLGLMGVMTRRGRKKQPESNV